MKNWEREAAKLNAEVGATLNRLQAAHERIDALNAALHGIATGLRWEEELRAWVLSDLGALTRARQALEVGR